MQLPPIIIPIQSSALYRRGLILTYLLAFYCLWTSSLSIWLLVLMALGVCGFGFRHAYDAKPYPLLRELYYRQGFWGMHWHHQPECWPIECVVMMRCGLFFLLKMSSVEGQPAFKSKIVVIFYDQITVDDRWRMNLGCVRIAR